MWGVIPAAGAGSRIQPLAFSKELLPIGSRLEGGHERPRAVSEYLVDRMLAGGADKLCFVTSPAKGDILSYFGGDVAGTPVFYAAQEAPCGLCDALFRALPLVGPDEPVLIGLPDTLWFPEDGFRRLPDDCLALLLFDVDHPERFDAVVTDATGRVRAVEVKVARPSTRSIWGALRVPGGGLGALHQLWLERDRRDIYLGTLIDAFVAAGGAARGVRAGERYVDVGTVDGYRQALRLLRARAAPEPG